MRKIIKDKKHEYLNAIDNYINQVFGKLYINSAHAGILFGKSKQYIYRIMLGLDDATHYSLEQFLQFCVFMEKTPCEILEEIKLAINMFYKQIVLHNGIPFGVTIPL